MKPDLGNIHAGDPAEKGERFAAETLRGLHNLGARVIVIGGTALRMLGSPIPSIDLDCLIPESDLDRHEVHDFIESRRSEHRTAYADSYLEVDALEWPNRIWNSNARYTPNELFRLAGTRILRTTLAKEHIQTEIPDLDALALMKIKAMGDRAAQLHHALEPTSRASLMPDALEAIKDIPPAFLRRKAGKDLADTAFLEQHGAQIQSAADLAQTLEIKGAVISGWTDVQDDLIEEAGRLLSRHDLTGRPKETLSRVRDLFLPRTG